MNEPSPTVAYITGASRGIGRMLATALQSDGAHVAGLARPSDDLDSLAAHGIVTVPTDVCEPESVAASFTAARSAIGEPTLLITCAGSIDGLGPVATVDPDAWWNAVTVDVRGTMLCTQEALKTMLPAGTGRIVTVYGNLGDDGRAHVSAFAAAKAGVARMTATLATELDGTGVSAICLHPGLVHTPMTEHLANSDTGRQWLPEFGPRASEYWGDGTDAVAMIRRINAGDADHLSGQTIHASLSLEAGRSARSRHDS